MPLSLQARLNDAASGDGDTNAAARSSAAQHGSVSIRFYTWGVPAHGVLRSKSLCNAVAALLERCRLNSLTFETSALHIHAMNEAAADAERDNSSGPRAFDLPSIATDFELDGIFLVGLDESRKLELYIDMYGARVDDCADFVCAALRRALSELLPALLRRFPNSFEPTGVALRDHYAVSLASLVVSFAQAAQSADDDAPFRAAMNAADPDTIVRNAAYRIFEGAQDNSAELLIASVQNKL